MASILTTTELRKMTADDLRSEIREHRAAASKVRLDVELKKEKNAAKAKMQRRSIARMLTVLAEKEQEGGKLPLNKKSKTRTVPAPAAS